MERLRFTVACIPMFNSYGLLDRLLTGDGRDSRSFQSVHGLIGALLAADIQLGEFEGRLWELEVGNSFELPVTAAQKTAFFGQMELYELRDTGEIVH